MSTEYTIQNSGIRDIFITELFPGIRAVKVPVGVIHEESHHPNHADMIYVCAMAAVSRSRNIFEIGTYRGQTTCGFASISEDVRVITLNLPPEEDKRYAPYIGQFIKDFPYKERIVQIFTDSKSFDTSPYANGMDYIFIDGDHSYSGVKNDTAKAMEMLRPGGIIVWHDYAAKTSGVCKFIKEFSQIKPVFRIFNTCLIVYLDGVNLSSFSPETLPPSLELSGMKSAQYSYTDLHNEIVKDLQSRISRYETEVANLKSVLERTEEDSKKRLELIHKMETEIKQLKASRMP